MKNYSAKAIICAKSSIVALVLSSVGFTAPAFAVNDSAIILNDSDCQLAGAGTAAAGWPHRQVGLCPHVASPMLPDSWHVSIWLQPRVLWHISLTFSLVPQ